ncbi:MAG TPA: NlpC/P60 family protein [Acidothermaceae bacterium]
MFALARRRGTLVALGPSPRRALRPLVTIMSAAGAALVAAALLPAVAGQAAQPTTVAQAEAQLDALNNQAEIASEQYNGAQERLTQALQTASAATAAAGRAHSDVVTEQGKVGALAAESYESGGLSQGLAIILNTTDPSQAMTRVSMLQQLSTSQSSLLAAAQTADQVYQQSSAAASQATATAAKLSADLAQKQAQINAALAQSKQVLATLTAAQRAQLIAAQKAKDAADQAKAQIALAAFNKAQAAQAAAARSAASRTAAARAATAAAAEAANKTLIKTVALPQSSGGSSVAQRAVTAAITRLGDRYVFGATGPTRFDCSGLVQWAYRQAGISTTHYTGTLYNDYRHIPESQLKPGDLVFFYRDHHHVGIYIGNGLMINAPHTGDVVRIASIAGHGYYSGAVRVVG